MAYNHKLDGLINISFLNRNGRTVASKVYHEGHSRVSSNVKLSNESTPYYFFISTGGGFLEGERYEVDIDVGDDSHAIVTTQAPTYVYKCDHDKMTTQYTNLTIGKNSIFEYLTDDIIPYKNSIYKQETKINMSETATLMLIDGVTAGWSEDEKLFQYKQLQMKTSIFMNSQLVYNDHLMCDSKSHDMSALGYFEGNTNFNSLIIISPLCTEDIIEWIRKSLEKIELKDVEFGISKLETNGFVLRALSDKAEKNRQVLMTALNMFRTEKLSLPDLQLSKNDNYF